MGKEHALLIALMNELKEKYEVVQRSNAEQLLTINSLESQTYALQVRDLWTCRRFGWSLQRLFGRPKWGC